MWLSVGVLLFIALKSIGIVEAYDKWFGVKNESKEDHNKDQDNEQQTPREGGESMPNNTNGEIDDEYKEDRD